MFEKQKHEWQEMDPKWRAFIVALVVAGSVAIFVFSQNRNAEAEARKPGALAGSTTSLAGDTSPGPAGKKFDWSALPSTNRNQGLEDVLAEVRLMREELSQYKARPAQPAGREPRLEATAPAEAIDLNAPIETGRMAATPPPVRFESKPTDAGLDTPKAAAPSATGAQTPPADAAPTPKVWQPVRVEAADAPAVPKVVIPVNAGLEAVLLSGVAARPSGSTGGAMGSAVSANSVGAPFVTRIKGDAILPNGWKLSDLGDCFLGGSAVAVLSAERAYAISDTLSCVAPNGEVYEGPVRAYGLDVDGTLGLAGKVVSKQGAILFQALLTGIASGLGTALTPTAIAGLNTNASNGSTQGVQYPDGDAIARTALGSGIGNATAQLSRFYLEFAKETFPVIEVVAGTRITWILKDTIELKRTRRGS